MRYRDKVGFHERFCSNVSNDDIRLALELAYMIVDVSKHLFGCDDQLCHFPYCLGRFSSLIHRIE